MPRQPRLDVPGLVHHVIARGIERREIFRDERDREAFVERLGELVDSGGARVYAWCLLSNHVHLVLKTGERSLAWLMRRLLTAHAVRYNLRHGRSGHLFQNRYKNIVVEEEEYLLELVRYVALNPVRAGLVNTPEELDRYPWSGHGVLTGTRAAQWQEVTEVLARFAPTKGLAAARYRQFVIDGWRQGRREEFSGGGLIRSAGGVAEVLRRRPEEREAADERILGGGAFVEEVWSAAEEQAVSSPCRDWQEILQETAERSGVAEEQILGRSRERRVSRARREFLRRSWEETGLSMTQLARLCRVNPATVSRAVQQAAHEARKPRRKIGK